jgi:hypothetical protein
MKIDYYGLCLFVAVLSIFTTCKKDPTKNASLPLRNAIAFLYRSTYLAFPLAHDSVLLPEFVNTHVLFLSL